jgi:DNA-binding MarR family transcriptional regulator
MEDLVKCTYFKKIYEQAFGRMLKSEMNVGMVVFAETLYSKTIRTQQELSDCVSCNKAHTSRTLLKMQNLGLVKMINPNENSPITLTKKGEKFAEECKAIRESLNKKLVENISKKDLETFKKVIDQIFANAQVIASNYQE